MLLPWANIFSKTFPNSVIQTFRKKGGRLGKYLKKNNHHHHHHRHHHHHHQHHHQTSLLSAKLLTRSAVGESAHSLKLQELFPSLSNCVRVKIIRWVENNKILQINKDFIFPMIARALLLIVQLCHSQLVMMMMMIIK